MREMNDTAGRFVKAFDEALIECMEKGTPAKMILGTPTGESVTIEVYRSKGDMKKLQDVILKTVQKEQGIFPAPKN
jgi:hypothetical protein